MSIKSIDSQIMMARTTDISRDTSALQKRPEVAQDTLAAQERINAAQDQSRIAETMESEMTEIRPDEDGAGGGEYEGGHGHGSEEDDEEAGPVLNMYVPASNNVIDIRI